MTAPLSTIYQLLESSDTKFRVFDMGRRVKKLSKDTFKQFEDATIAYPYPLQQKAWFAVLFWDKERSQESFLWFLSFQLDEQGKLIQATRNHFISMVVEVLGTQLTGGGQKQEALDNNPYTFKPDQNKLAMLNAKIKEQMNQDASVYYEHAQNYIRGLIGWDNYEGVGVQGLADYVTRLNQDFNLDSLVNALDNMPVQVSSVTLSLLEHINIPTTLAEVINKSALAALAQNDKAGLLNCIRGISYASAKGLRRELLKTVLQSPLGTDPDVLIVITGRCWQDLKDDELRRAFMENLATASPDHQLFIGLVSDLVAIPDIREQMLQGFRDSERSVALATAIGQLFSQSR